MTTYKHTQVGWVPLVLTTTIFIILSISGKTHQLYSSFHFLWIVLIFIGVISCFILMVKVDDQQVKISYAFGIIRVKILFKNIDFVHLVKNPWWYGWGMNFMVVKSIPKGWLFHVWGRGAVELIMRNGKIYRIGTDEPQKLMEQIQSRLQK